MNFMKAYKRLDRLCKEHLNYKKGISTYIFEMTKIKYGQDKVITWKEDYKRLKRYRYIRNKIAHDELAEEADLCTSKDVAWLNEFYKRILNKEDSLTCYYNKRYKSIPRLILKFILKILLFIIILIILVGIYHLI